ncbi:hypothetical protein BAE44_0012380, partial [Dichanthelium oligosanthes]
MAPLLGDKSWGTPPLLGPTSLGTGPLQRLNTTLKWDH